MFIVPMHHRLPRRHFGHKWLRSPWGDRVIGFCLGRHLWEIHFFRGLPCMAGKRDGKNCAGSQT